MNLPNDLPVTRTPKRIHHTLRTRMLTVQKRETLSPHFLRLTFGGDDLHDFISPGFDDHVKLCFPNPETGDIVFPGSGSEAKPIMREYTPRFFDANKQQIVIDFVIHEHGIATEWAKHAAVGDPLGMAGPKNSFILSTDFDWHLFIGDETAIPAIARRLEELPQHAQAIAFIEITNADDQLNLPTTDQTIVHWVHRHDVPAGTTALLAQHIMMTPFPSGDYFAWIAGEYQVVKELRELLTTQKATNPQWIRAASYWKKAL